jgi:hypothetical protein
MSDTPERLAQRLLTEGEKTGAFFAGLSDVQWDTPVYTEGSIWKARQILAHFVTTEISMTRLIENIAAGGPGSPEDFDIDRFNERKVTQLKDSTIDELLRQFEDTRQRTAQVVSSLDIAALTKIGRHPFLGPAALTDIIKLVYRHNQIHLRDIRRTLDPGAMQSAD